LEEGVLAGVELAGDGIVSVGLQRERRGGEGNKGFGELDRAG